MRRSETDGRATLDDTLMGEGVVEEGRPDAIWLERIVESTEEDAAAEVGAMVGDAVERRSCTVAGCCCCEDAPEVCRGRL